jgi:hypothetical protein
MALQYQVDTLDGLDDGIRGLYTEKEGKFVLGIEGIPQPEDVSGLKAKVDELLAEKKAASDRARQAAEEAEAAKLEAAKKGGDVEALEKSYKAKMAEIESRYKTELEQRDGSIVELTSGQTATSLAAELAIQGSADVLLPHIKARLRTEFREGRPVTVVLDKEGKPSAATVEDLKNEFISSPAFAPLIVASKASGAGRSLNATGGAVKQGNLGGSKAERVAAIQAMINNS